MLIYPEEYRILGNPGHPGAFTVKFQGRALKIIASDLFDWDHVSVSLAHRCPTWEEMCCVKSLFWELDDCVMQVHPSPKDYVNVHPYCLHLWRPQKIEIPLPPTILV